MASSTDVSMRIGVEGEQDFKKSLKDIDSNLKVLSSEMKAVTSEFIGNEKSSKSLASQNEVLTKTYEAQKSKVELLTQQLEKEVELHGEDSKNARDLQIQLNKATAEMNKSSAAIESNSDAIKENTKLGINWKDSMSAIGSAVGAVAKATAAAAAAMATAAGAAAVKLGKQALTAYADYEQLVGGVETLFGDSSGAVQKYAENAFKTAGLSANDYMETVTGFSASLLNSLGGDTQKAAKLADQAITDMSDNANKMGSDMESLKNAYAGFAKGQFNMLDNLKLGYGGTKEEMERLLADAKEISGIDYNIDSYADIIDAIHVIQTEMKITGTTAKEAEATISGSLGMLKGAWTNLVAGLGNPDADIEELVNNVIDSAASVLENVTPIIENIVETIPSALDAIVNSMVEMLPTLLDTAVSLFESILNAIVTNLPQLIPVIVQAVLTITDTLIDNLPLLISAALQIILALAGGLIQALPELIKKIPEIIVGIVKAIKDNLPQIKEAGANLIRGFWEGIQNLSAWLWEKVSGFFSGIVDGVKNFLGIHSPSTVFAGIGKNMALGLGKGWDNGFERISDDITNSVSGISVSAPMSEEAAFRSSFVGGMSSMGEIIINLTAELDGAVLAQKQYRYNQLETARHGGSLVNA